ncbi:MAG: cobalt transporter subunit CbtA [Celeribacter sp.]|jgi:cobalt transporter subunit CbtA
MYRRVLASALYAGLGAGLIAALLQFYFVIPTLLEGELFESGQKIHFILDGTSMSDRSHLGIGTDWMRHLMTVSFDVVTYMGYGLILIGLMALAEQRGLTSVTPRQGVIWGLAGFVAIQLAPAIGMPPELPGTIGAELAPRQAWWLGTLVASSFGLWLIAFGKGPIALVGIVLLAIPQIVGAPHLDTFWGVAPPELAAEFATLSLGTAAAGWTVLGWLCSYFWTRDA